MDRDEPLLHRIGEVGARIGSRPPRSRALQIGIQVGLATLVFGFLVVTVVDQWSEIRDRGAHFDVLWLLPALLVLPAFYVLSAVAWDLILRFLGHPLGFAKAQVAWGQPLLARYVPGSVLYFVGRVLLPERAGVPRRIALASLIYEQALQVTSAVCVSAAFLIGHPDLHDQPLRWGVVALIPAAAVLLHPRVFGPLANFGLRALGREPLSALVPGWGIVALLLFYAFNWEVVGIGAYFVARATASIPAGDISAVVSAQAIGCAAAFVIFLAPAGLGVRDTAFAWALKASVPGGSFAIASLIAISVRAVLTLVEVLYVAAVTALGRRRAGDSEA